MLSSCSCAGQQATAQKMQRTGMHERACGKGMGQNPGRGARAHAQPQEAPQAAARPANNPGIIQNPGIPAQQMQRTGTRERACGSGTGQNPLEEHAQHDLQPRSIAWGGGGEAAMKGGAPCFLRESGRDGTAWRTRGNKKRGDERHTRTHAHTSTAIYASQRAEIAVAITGATTRGAAGTWANDSVRPHQ